MKSLNLIKSINESTRAIRSLKKNSIEIDKAINLIFGTLKKKKSFYLWQWRICKSGRTFFYRIFSKIK